ncbi:hypothetical protein A3A93_03420 [Candidatus Roizmanbacteria bacterium RIFCSPLOWO2_01_FULL_38_12]|uniref:Uncharacterized protein n=1 Tax=Candidatus Roizmanbacteria bacterium RIFCSPLOWO2_01_FULL_38_12 TaxID=1802061 RepID=A0A1F7ISQ2_9BACT|nr:MAG: hypothetical protein A2861_01300 [Candidatus Roizmanbacteria bacterium RIFCSPHIGHO2_01_FULL_38_15]OGK35819.1 MAG: hypothetical protein A3F59_03705 [Candidatus Roizmanbacteria bacterium RIFCSPHIGHO2_12_FULL_38_13]OGK46392.1 MAG: hypothetical protein A3A93_03420 [Candidatus Roizmanbacteria bacterium RIFCSPLOWO2_01_FULL_38_12]
MPKKTKKQKIAAAKRKHTIFIKTEVNPPSIEAKTTNTQEMKIKSEPKILTNSRGVSLFKKDLTKSLILTFLILLLEIGLYLVREKNLILFS